MLRFKSLPLLFLAALALSGCGRHTDSYYPLAQGWTWMYGIEVKTQKGVRRFRYTVANVGRGVLDGRDVWIQRTTNGARRYYREDRDGILWVGETMPDEPPGVFPAPRTVLPDPVTPASPPWSNPEYTTALSGFGPPKGPLHIDISVKVTVNYAVQSVDDQVEVPAGRFLHCVRIHGEGETQADIVAPVGRTTIHVAATEWFAPGVGLVKVERRETTSSSTVPSGEWRMQLEEMRHP